MLVHLWKLIDIGMEIGMEMAVHGCKFTLAVRDLVLSCLERCLTDQLMVGRPSPLPTRV